MVKVPASNPVAARLPSRNPFQVLLLFAVALSGAGSVFGFGPPPSLLVTIPDYMVVIWGLINLAAGVLGLLGAWWPDHIMGLLMERLALQAVAIPEGIYGVVVYAKNGNAAWTAAVFTIGFALACGIRAWEVRRELERHRKWINVHLRWEQGP